jgi:histidyl-tRNA synthetase
MSQISTQPYKGTRDFYPEDMRIQTWMFNRLREAVGRYGYQEYDGPMLEPFDLYAAKSGEELVNQQLYWLIDRGERKTPRALAAECGCFGRGSASRGCRDPFGRA